MLYLRSIYTKIADRQFEFKTTRDQSNAASVYYERAYSIVRLYMSKSQKKKIPLDDDRIDTPIPSDVSSSSSTRKKDQENDVLQKKLNNMTFKPKNPPAQKSVKSPMDCVMPEGFQAGAKPEFKAVKAPKKK